MNTSQTFDLNKFYSDSVKAVFPNPCHVVPVLPNPCHMVPIIETYEGI